MAVQTTEEKHYDTLRRLEMERGVLAVRISELDTGLFMMSCSTGKGLVDLDAFDGEKKHILTGCDTDEVLLEKAKLLRNARIKKRVALIEARNMVCKLQAAIVAERKRGTEFRDLIDDEMESMILL